MNRRCILKKDCENLKVLGHQYATVQWKLHKDECIKDCPSGFMEEKNKCKMCEGPCPKGENLQGFLKVFNVLKTLKHGKNLPQRTRYVLVRLGQFYDKMKR